MLKKLKNRSEGFTIIEVLIVLAIAGLIMVIVFIAVPNLRRTANNNRYTTEANNLLSAYSEVSSNNGGAVLANGVSTAGGNDAAKVLAAANSTDYKTVTIQSAGLASTATAPPSLTAVVFVTGYKCATDKTNVTPVLGTTRSVAMYYQIEGPTANVDQCVGN